MPLYGAEKTGLSLQASEQKIRDLIPPLFASKTQNIRIPQKSNIALRLLIPAVFFTDTIKRNDDLLLTAVSDNALIPASESLIKTQEPVISTLFGG